MADGLARIRFLGTVLGYTRSSIILVWFHRMPEGKNIWMLRESNEYEKASQDDAQGSLGLSAANETSVDQYWSKVCGVIFETTR